LTFTCSTDFF